MTRFTVIVTVCLTVLLACSICYSQTDSLSISPPVFQLYGAPNEVGNLKPNYAVISFIVTNNIGTTQIMHYTLHSSKNWFSEEGEKQVPYKMWQRKKGASSSRWVEYEELINRDTLSFQSILLIEKDGIDTITFSCYTKSNPKDILEKTSIFTYDSKTAVEPIEYDSFMLFPPYPHPFGGMTLMKFFLPYPGMVNIMFQDSIGIIVDTLLSGRRSAGMNQTVVNSNNISSGFYTIIGEFDGQYSDSLKIAFIK